MEKILKKKNINLNQIFISFLFSSFIFFWGINFNFLQPRFLIFLLIIPILFKLDKILIKKIIKYFFFACLVFFHSIIQTSNNSFYFLFEIFGFFFLCIIFDVYKNHFFEKINQIIFIFLIFLFGYIIISYFTWDDYSVQVSNSCIGCFSILREFFNENSHFAIAITPVIFLILFSSNIKSLNKSILLFLIFILSYLNPSITLIAGLMVLIFGSSLIFWKTKKTLILFIISIFLIIISNKHILNDRNNITDIFTQPQKINLSSEVYLASLYVAKKAIFTKPLGYGFNNYHYAFDEFIEDFKPSNKQVLLLNRKDASNNFSKIITEFGVLSFFYFYLLISFFFNKNIDNKTKLFLIIPLIIQTFVRGAGYFNGGFLLFAIYLFILCKNQSNVNYKFK